MRSIFVSAVVLASLASSAQAALLNGSFELQVIAQPDRVSINTATSWTATGGQMLLERGVNGVSNIAAQDGNQFVSMGHNSAVNDTLTQNVATIAGQSIDLSFFVACIQGDAFQRITAQAIDVATNIVLAEVNADISSRTQGWIGYGFQFEATGATTRVRFAHIIASDFANIALDNVVMTPAPSSAGLLALAGVAGVRRRR